jgi:FtsP/CotA-like multicopper oxidase with cupredoxin domain
VPNGMDGVAGLTQEAIAPGKTFRYEFTFDRRARSCITRTPTR